ncbi:MAG: type II toxin-antitoxin system CcdA family antitoxin [Leptolyngbya sp. SIO4C1]|nr:type II toxin-antitoxin system CcdA family antitoxin [Leptolyngbya sp. SIO4C1]
MTQSFQKRRVSVTIDASLLQEIDRLTDNRSAAFEEALRLWRAQRIEAELRTYYQSCSQPNAEFENNWADYAYQQLKETETREEI